MIKSAFLANRNRVLRQEFNRVLERRRELRENISRGFFFIDGACSELIVTTTAVIINQASSIKRDPQDTFSLSSKLSSPFRNSVEFLSEHSISVGQKS